jgi:hypothetical protein
VTTRRGLVPLALLVILIAAAPAQGRQRSFHTPSGNIRCLYRSAAEDGGPLLRCDVLSLNDVGFTLDRRHRGKRVHVTDAVPEGHVLPYGAKRRLGPFTCRSRRTGLTCRSRPSGHGFKLSRERQRVF